MHRAQLQRVADDGLQLRVHHPVQDAVVEVALDHRGGQIVDAAAGVEQAHRHLQHERDAPRHLDHPLPLRDVGDSALDQPGVGDLRVEPGQPPGHGVSAAEPQVGHRGAAAHQQPHRRGRGEQPFEHRPDLLVPRGVLGDLEPVEHEQRRPGDDGSERVGARTHRRGQRGSVRWGWWGEAVELHAGLGAELGQQRHGVVRGQVDPVEVEPEQRDGRRQQLGEPGDER